MNGERNSLKRIFSVLLSRAFHSLRSFLIAVLTAFLTNPVLPEGKEEKNETEKNGSEIIVLLHRQTMLVKTWVAAKKVEKGKKSRLNFVSPISKDRNNEAG